MSWISSSLNSLYSRQIMSTIPLANASLPLTTIAFDSNYVYGSSGDAVYTLFVPMESGDLTDFWIYVSSYTGTWASTDGKINVQIRLGQAANGIPGTSLIGSFDIILDGSTTGWIRTSGLSINLTATQVYSIVIGDSDGSASNYVTIITSAAATNAVGVALTTGFTHQNTSTLNGYSSAGTSTGTPICCVLQQANLIYSGSIFGSINLLANTRYERGIKFKPEENCTVVGYSTSPDIILSNNMILKIYEDGVNPKSTTLMNYTFPSFSYTGTNPGVYSFIIPSSYHVSLEKNNWYRFVLYPSVSMTTPRKATLLGTPDSYILQSLPFGGNCYHTLENVSGSWDDDTSSISFLSPILVPNTDNTEKVSFTIS